MKPAAKGTLEPKLRFPEFRDAGEWEVKPLKEVADPVSERATQGAENNVLSLSGEHGIVLQSEFFGKKMAGENSERYLKIVRNDFVYNDRTTKASTYGTIKRLSKYSGGIVSPIYKCFRFNANENPAFWEWYFESGIHNKQLRSLVNEGARTGRFNISISQFLSTTVWRPNKDEQQKIADCLSSIDELITMEAQKLDTLKAHKKGLMQLLFPAEGETLPKLRFPEFRDAGEWDEITLGDITTKTDKKNKGGKKYPIYSINNTVGFVPQAEQFEGVDSNKRGYDITLYKVIERNTFAYNPARINVGSIGYSGDLNNIIISSLYVCFKTNKNVDDQFLLHFFGTFTFDKSVNSNVEGGIRNYLFYENFSRIKIPLPNKDEQQKIADCLSSIDELVTMEAQKLDTLKAHKKGLMQLLFPALDEVAE